MDQAGEIAPARQASTSYGPNEVVMHSSPSVPHAAYPGTPRRLVRLLRRRMMVIYKVTVYYKADVPDEIHWFTTLGLAGRFHEKIAKEYDENIRRSNLERIPIGKQGVIGRALRRTELVDWLNTQFAPK